MSYEDNPYNHAEKYGLTLVGEVELSEPCWSFDLAILFKDADGLFYWAFDSGCSCPSPFEDLKFDELSRGTLTQFQAEVEESLSEGYDQGKAELVDLLIRATARPAS